MGPGVRRDDSGGCGRNTAYDLIPAARSARVFQFRCPSPWRGRRESRAPTAPAVPCAKV